MIQDYVSITKSNLSFDDKRNNQEEYWLYETLNQALKDQFYQNEHVQKELKIQLERLRQKKTTPYEVASLLFSKMLDSKR